jgi:ParB family transcriptional regulator, chromosome partitioning protein
VSPAPDPMTGPRGTETQAPAAGGYLIELPLSAVAPNPDQPRKVFSREPLEELADSIRSLGVVEPIVVRPAGDGWMIVAGERRWRAATMAGLTTIPAIVRDELDDHDAFVLSMVENVLRKDMNPVEEADGYAKLLEGGLTIDELATRLGKRAAAIKSALTLRTLEPGIRDMVAKGHVTAWDGTRLATLSWNGQARALNLIVKGGLTGNDRDRVIGQVWCEEHEVSMFGDDELPAADAKRDELRAAMESAMRALTRATAAIEGRAPVPDAMTIELAEAVLKAAGTVAKVTRAGRVARMLEVG